MIPYLNLNHILMCFWQAYFENIFFQKIIAILWKWTTECFKLVTDIIYGYKSHFSAYFDKHIFEKHIYRLFFLQYLENEPLNLLKLITDIIYGYKSHFSAYFDKHIFEKIFIIFFAIPWKWTECFETDCGPNLWIEIRFENIELLLSTYAQFWNFNVLHKQLFLVYQL